jgi:hypothetical protein
VLEACAGRRIQPGQSAAYERCSYEPVYEFCASRKSARSTSKSSSIPLSVHHAKGVTAHSPGLTAQRATLGPHRPRIRNPIGVLAVSFTSEGICEQREVMQINVMVVVKIEQIPGPECRHQIRPAIA